MGRPTGECESHVTEKTKRGDRIRSTCGHVEPAGKVGGPPSKPKYYLMTDRGEVL